MTIGKIHLRSSHDSIDAATTALVQLSAAALPRMSGAVMTGLERALKIEPQQKPALRKFIADSYAAHMSPQNFIDASP